RVRIDTYILPLIQSSQYRELRILTQDGATKFNLSGIPKTAVIQGILHISPGIRNLLESFLPGKPRVGDWFILRLDYGTAFHKLAEAWVGHDVDPKANPTWESEPWRLLEHLPLTAGLQLRNPKTFARTIKELESSFLGGTKRTEL